jgi:hypothetical protein
MDDDLERRLAEHERDKQWLIGVCHRWTDPTDPAALALCKISADLALSPAEGAIWSAYAIKIGVLVDARLIEIIDCGLRFPCAKQS